MSSTPTSTAVQEARHNELEHLRRRLSALVVDRLKCSSLQIDREYARLATREVELLEAM